MKASCLYPTFTRIVDLVRCDLIARGVEAPVWKNGAKVQPMTDALPGLFYSYTETVKGTTKDENTYVEHWCYMEVRYADGSIGPTPGLTKGLVPIVWSPGWKEWMFNFNPSICDCVAYHVRVIRERCDELQAERLAKHCAERPFTGDQATRPAKLLPETKVREAEAA